MLWREKLLGILWSQIGTLIFTFIFASGKFLHGSVPLFQLAFLRYLGGFCTVLLVLTLRRQLPEAVASRYKKYHGLRACLGMGALLSTFYAAQHMPLADATSIGLTEGIFILLFAALLLKEPIGWFHIAATLIGAMGAYIVVGGTSHSLLDLPLQRLIPAAIALIGALLLALEFIVIKYVADRDSPATLLFMVTLMGTVFGGLLSILSWQPLHLYQWIFGLGLGPLATVAQYSNIRALKFVGPGFLAPFGYSWAIHAALLGFIAFHEIPSLHTLLGGSLILGSGIAIIFWERRVVLRTR